MKDKSIEYAAKILAQIQEIFDEDSDNYIDVKELSEGNNLTEFMHALANLAPNMVYSKFTGDDVNSLEFNHLANKLCFQFSEKAK